MVHVTVVWEEDSREEDDDGYNGLPHGILENALSIFDLFPAWKRKTKTNTKTTPLTDLVVLIQEASCFQE